MSEANQFRSYADEAFSWAAQSTTAKEKTALLALARTWAQAAIAADAVFGGSANEPPEHIGR
jgi:hypothetical protein